MAMIMKKRYEELKKLILHWVDEDKERMVRLCSELVRCKTPDPPGDTREAMDVVERFMADSGLPYKILGVNDTIRIQCLQERNRDGLTTRGAAKLPMARYGGVAQVI